jgi:hypothetical protein
MRTTLLPRAAVLASRGGLCGAERAADAACAAHARCALALALAATRPEWRVATLAHFLRAGGAASRRILASLDEYGLEWQCELLVQEAGLY